MTRQAVLKREQQSAIAGGPSIVESNDRVVVRTICRVQQCQQPALLRIGCRRTWIECMTGDRARPALNVHGRIQSPRAPEMNRIGPDVTCFGEPIGSDLLFDAEIPLVQIWRMIIQRNVDVGCLFRESRILVERIRERITAWQTEPWIREAARRTVVCDRLSPRRLI